jgi:hypothetical protein
MHKDVITVFIEENVSDNFDFYVTDVRGKLKFQIFGILVNVTVKDTKF